MRYMGYPLLFLSTLLLVTSASAFTLGKVTVPLASRAASSVNAAEKVALTRLLVQLTGHEDVTALAGTRQLLSQPEQWLSSYGYDASPSGGLLLTTDFDVQALSRALMTAGAPVWSLSRPPLLLWTATPGGLMTADNSGRLDTTAKQRGLPLHLPESAAELDVANISGHFMQPIFAASKSYNTSLVATAVIYAGSSPTLRWWLYQDGQLLTRGSGSAASVGGAEALLIDQLTNALSSRYAVQAGQSGNYQLTVNGVKTLASWHQLDSYLTSLAGMNAVAMRQVNTDQASWTLVFAGDGAQLEHLLAVNSHLQHCPRSAVDAAPMALTHSPAASSRLETTNTDPTVASGANAMPAGMVFCWKP